MKEQTLTVILTEELKANKDGNDFQLPEGTRLTVFLTTPTNLFPVPKVTAITLKGDYTLLTSEDGRVFTDLSDITAIRVDEEASKKEGGLGFR